MRKAWHGVRLDDPDWSPCSHSLAFGSELPRDGIRFHMIWNAYWEALDFELPVLNDGQTWRRWIDTALDSPSDIVDTDRAETVPGSRYQVGRRSVVVLITSSTVTGRSDTNEAPFADARGSDKRHE